jgi:hypothetical protein
MGCGFERPSELCVLAEIADHDTGVSGCIRLTAVSFDFPRARHRERYVA